MPAYLVPADQLHLIHEPVLLPPRIVRQTKIRRTTVTAQSKLASDRMEPQLSESQVCSSSSFIILKLRLLNNIITMNLTTACWHLNV